MPVTGGGAPPVRRRLASPREWLVAARPSGVLLSGETAAGLREDGTGGPASASMRRAQRSPPPVDRGGPFRAEAPPTDGVSPRRRRHRACRPAAPGLGRCRRAVGATGERPGRPWPIRIRRDAHARAGHGGRRATGSAAARFAPRVARRSETVRGSPVRRDCGRTTGGRDGRTRLGIHATRAPFPASRRPSRTFRAKAPPFSRPHAAGARAFTPNPRASVPRSAARLVRARLPRPRIGLSRAATQAFAEATIVSRPPRARSRCERSVQAEPRARPGRPSPPSRRRPGGGTGPASPRPRTGRGFVGEATAGDGDRAEPVAAVAGAPAGPPGRARLRRGSDRSPDRRARPPGRMGQAASAAPMRERSPTKRAYSRAFASSSGRRRR